MSAESNISFRRVNISDESELKTIADIDITIPALHDPEFPVNDKTKAERLQFLKEKFDDNDFFDICLNSRNQIIGFHVVKKTMHFNNRPVGRIDTLWVHPDFRNKGIARQLKLRAESWGKSLGLDHLYTWVQAGNHKMLTLNQTMGYETVNFKMVKKL